MCLCCDGVGTVVVVVRQLFLSFWLPVVQHTVAYLQHYGSGLLPSGDVADVEASLSDEPDGRGTAVDRERMKVARERLQAKIARIMDQIRVEQASKEGESCLYICTQN